MRENIAERRAYVKSLLDAGRSVDPREVAKMWGSSYPAVIADIAACHGEKSPYDSPVHPVDAQNMRAKRMRASGMLTKDGWKSILEEHDYACVICGTKDNIVIDHIVPLSKGGTNTLDNVQPLCISCNSVKGNRPMEFATTRVNGRLGGRPRKQD